MSKIIVVKQMDDAVKVIALWNFLWNIVVEVMEIPMSNFIRKSNMNAIKLHGLAIIKIKNSALFHDIKALKLNWNFLNLFQMHSNVFILIVTHTSMSWHTSQTLVEWFQGKSDEKRKFPRWFMIKKMEKSIASGCFVI